LKNQIIPFKFFSYNKFRTKLISEYYVNSIFQQAKLSLLIKQLYDQVFCCNWERRTSNLLPTDHLSESCH